MSLEKFTPDELTPKRFVPTPFGPPVAVLSTPISYKENVLRAYAENTKRHLGTGGL